eukprot:superscaffoldBa00003974_g18051
MHARTGDFYHRVNRLNHAARSSTARLSAFSSRVSASGSPQRACGSAASPATPGRSPTSVGRLISNRSSRLAFQWLMMSASFLLSSSLLPDMVDSVSGPLRPAVTVE